MLPHLLFKNSRMRIRLSRLPTLTLQRMRLPLNLVQLLMLTETIIFLVSQQTRMPLRQKESHLRPSSSIVLSMSIGLITPTRSLLSPKKTSKITSKNFPFPLLPRSMVIITLFTPAALNHLPTCS